MSNTLLLDRTSWDLCIDAAGNIALAGEPYALTQDAASAIRLFQGDYWYNIEIGVPYFQQVLGKNPPVNLLKQLLINAAETVPNVKGAAVYLKSVTGGQITGQVQVVDNNGKTSIANF